MQSYNTCALYITYMYYKLFAMIVFMLQIIQTIVLIALEVY